MVLCPRNIQSDVCRSIQDINVPRATPSLTGTPLSKNLFRYERRQNLQTKMVNGQWDFPRFRHIPRPDDALHRLQVVVVAQQWSRDPTLGETLNFVSGLPGFSHILA